MTLEEKREMEQFFQNDIKKQRQLLQDFIDLDIHVGVAPGTPSGHEVIQGHFGPFRITKASHAYYYTVQGPVPLFVARLLYAEPLGKREIRVAGHCGCPPPEYPWVERHAPDGRKVLPTAERLGFLGFGDKLGMSLADLNAQYVFSDTPVEGETQTVDLYHIDSKAALKLFTETLRRELLSDPEETPLAR